MSRAFVRRTLERVAGRLGGIAHRISPTVEEARVAPWFRDHGDQTLRLDYDLSPEALVFDVGGYEGQWASDIFARYCCRIHVFEIAPPFAEAITARFARNPAIRVFPFGLAAADGAVDVSIDRDATSIFRPGSSTVSGRLVRAAGFLEEEGITRIDLMKINIEGGEYDLLDHLIASGRIGSIRDVQIQFHDFVPHAAERMAAIQKALERTHQLTWQYPFVWENWRLRSMT